MAVNKAQGATLGAIILAGILLRPLGSYSPQPGPSPNGIPKDQNVLKSAGRKSVGPWIASCNYWAPARQAEDDEAKNPPSPHGTVNGIRYTIDGKSSNLDLGLDTTHEGDEQACKADDLNRWGLPNYDPRPGADHPSVTAVIATVPDPVHTNLALQFDRRVDALLQAAAANQYVSSFHWLPWKNRLSAFKTTESYGDQEPGHDPEREREPGLIVLKHVTADPSLASTSYFQVIYLFLVAESPTWGVDGFQLRKAFAYEHDLHDALQPPKSTRGSVHQQRIPASQGSLNSFYSGHAGHIAIIGPAFTGSASSLKEEIQKEAEIVAKDQTFNAASEKLRARPVPSNAPNEPEKENKPTFDLAGETSTQLGLQTLALNSNSDLAKIDYLSFSANFEFDQNSFLRSLKCSGKDLSRVALLVEDNSAAGSATFKSLEDSRSKADKLQPDDPELRACDPAPGTVPNAQVLGSTEIIRFPREISLLRNAQSVTDQGGESGPGGSPPSPYLHLSLKDSNTTDGVPQFSRETTPLSQEAQLMAIAHQLQRDRIEYIGISATNTLDEIFLMQFLHRARPDARLFSVGGDLLRDREIDNVPFVGTISINPSSMISLGKSQLTHVFPDTASVSDYNAASYTFWNLSESQEKRPAQPSLVYYSNIFEPLPDPKSTAPPPPMYPALWVTAIGTDGNYPLAILSPCASDSPQLLPVFNPGIDDTVFDSVNNAAKIPPGSPGSVPLNSACGHYYGATHDEKAVRGRLKNAHVFSSLLWEALCALVSLLCLSHTVMLWVADYGNLFTRDLAIVQNDQPRRRSMAVHVGAAMLFSMAFVVAWPLLSIAFLAHVDRVSIEIAWMTLGFGLASVVVTFWKTRHYIWWARSGSAVAPGITRLARAYMRIKENKHLFINFLAWATLVLFPIFWNYQCDRELAPSSGSPFALVGVSFSFRCLHPASGLSPLIPVLLLLFGWYLWAFFQIRRLRFSISGRPQIPRKFNDDQKDRFFVSDQDLSQNNSSQNSCLYENILCFLITRNTIHRFRKLPQPVADVLLLLIYAALMVSLSVFTPIQTLTHFLGHHRHLANPYEMLIGGLFFPLMAIALSGWLRVVMVWSSLKSGLLDRLENLPIRFAFDRLEEMGWMTMLRQDGLHRQLRDQARSIESLGQMLNENDLKRRLAKSHTDQSDPKQSGLDELKSLYNNLLETMKDIRAITSGHPGSSGKTIRPYDLTHDLEINFAKAGRALLEHTVVPYWQNQRIGLVESKEQQEVPIKALPAEAETNASKIPLQLHTGAASSDPPYIQVAEEFLAIRYLSLIRAVLAHLGSLMSFVSASFVLAIVAWNSYPFQPREEVNWILTAVLVFLGSGVVWVFAQMHRDPILSRITETNANELGFDFYVRIISFGALPVFTWLAYQFPEIGSAVFKFIQPGLDVVK